MATMLESSREGLATVEYRDEASLLLIAGDEAGLDRLEGWADQAGCRVAGRATIDMAAEQLDRRLALDAAVLDLDGEGGDAGEALLDRLAARAKAGRHGSVVALPADRLDSVAGLLLEPRIEALVEPHPHDWVAAIAAAAARPTARFQDITKGKGTARLQQLSAEFGRMATLLAELSEDEQVAAATGASEPEEDESRRIDAGFVRSIIRARRLREQFFRGEWFADPAWDMMLDLMAARLDRQRVAVSSLCIAAAVPPTTALRWIKALCEQGLFVRVADPQDGRRVFIELSDDAATTLEACLKAAHRLSPLIL